MVCRPSITVAIKYLFFTRTYLMWDWIVHIIVVWVSGLCNPKMPTVFYFCLNFTYRSEWRKWIYWNVARLARSAAKRSLPNELCHWANKTDNRCRYPWTIHAPSHLRHQFWSPDQTKNDPNVFVIKKECTYNIGVNKFLHF